MCYLRISMEFSHCTSGPGLSLNSETASISLPAYIWKYINLGKPLSILTTISQYNLYIHWNCVKCTKNDLFWLRSQPLETTDAKMSSLLFAPTVHRELFAGSKLDCCTFLAQVSTNTYLAPGISVTTGKYPWELTTTFDRIEKNEIQWIEMQCNGMGWWWNWMIMGPLLLTTPQSCITFQFDMQCAGNANSNGSFQVKASFAQILGVQMPPLRVWGVGEGSRCHHWPRKTANFCGQGLM